MMLSDLSVRRPVFAAVAAIILCVVGLAAFFSLPVRELPSVDPPVVSVNTTYRGASAEVIEERITEVIERQVAGIQGDRPGQLAQPRRPLAGQHLVHAGPRPRRRRQRRARRGQPRRRRSCRSRPTRRRSPRPNADSQPIMILLPALDDDEPAAAVGLRRPLSGRAAVHRAGRGQGRRRRRASSTPCASGWTPPPWPRAA